MQRPPGSTSKLRWTLTAVYLLLLALIAWRQGFATDKEALKYVGCAQAVLHADLHDLVGNYAKFATYVVFLLPFVAVGLPLAAVIAQAALAIAAAHALARLVERLGGNTRTADAAFVLALCCYPWQTWVLALYTESLFTSLMVLLLERATRAGPWDRWTWALAAAVLFTRPVGMLFVGPLLVWRTLQGRTWPLLARAAAYGSVLVLALVLPGIPRAQLAPIVECHVICGFPERPDAMATFNGTSLLAAQHHIWSHGPATYAAGLFLRRVASLFTLIRPYYSNAHNAAVAVYYALLIAAPFGAWRARREPLAKLMLTILALNIILIGLTHDEWSGRFLVPLWPLLIAFAALAIGPILRRRSDAPHL